MEIDAMIGLRPPAKICLDCNRKCVYPERMFDDWFYPKEQICFDCLMINCNRYDQIRPRKPPGKMADRAELLFPLTVYDTSNNTKIGEYHNKEDVLAAVDKYKQERKSRARILVIHYPTFYNFTDYSVALASANSTAKQYLINKTNNRHQAF
jgi:hypothetical protein